MRKTNVRKVVVYIMLFTMLASTLLMGLSTFL
ncbi:stressosome-associated protein Prli42 [Mesobacillus sp. LC4]|uniref:Stressosome-associated protein Prli42 n=2 Tax=Mesobacillus TaxID=2675231 RepID=A0A846TLQ4_9BACI|nr:MULTISPECIES: stressosome-associated protein Prli42 [Mesobacillus]NKE05005.1 stressosome-associated protein Prli42 [Mesobacillus selenatarsenatis]WNF21630.1 stressosome-associated protein Prli42 [Mesobacillus jeotgali]